MDNYNINSNEIIYMFLKMAQRIIDFDKTSLNYGLNVPIYNAEIHTIVAIKENEGISITGLAKELGITKGAVSQIVNRLQKKETVIKDQDPMNKSRLVLRLTKDGETAYKYHEKYHEIYLDPLKTNLDNMDEISKQTIYNFLKETSEYFMNEVIELE